MAYVKTKILPFLLLNAILHANPASPSVVHGDASLNETANCLEVQTSNQAIINWDAFSIQKGEVTRFIQPSIDSAVLNRVTGSEISQILGQLEANGRVYLVNPNGVLIGPEGRIDTAAFMASVLDMSDAEFLNGETLSFDGDSLGSIINFGKIETRSGPISLIAHYIENKGDLISPETVSLTSGHSLLLDPTGDALIYIHPNIKADGVDNSGRIEAFKTQIQTDCAPTSLAIGLGGMIEANRAVEVGGEIYLVAGNGDIEIERGGLLNAGFEGTITVHAENNTTDCMGTLHAPSGTVQLLGKNVYLREDALVDVSGPTQGGTLLVGGDKQGSNPLVPNAEYVYAGPDVFVDASAKLSGDGGKVIFWADRGIGFFSTVHAQGGAERGNGGFVEVSSPESFTFSGLVSTLAPNGTSGMLLLDPTDITISTAATAGGAFGAGPPYTFSSAAASATLNNIDLQNQLALGSVTVDATAGGGLGNGDITISPASPVSWSTNNSLTLTSGNNVSIDSNLTCSGTGNIITTCIQFFQNSGTISTNGAVNITTTGFFFNVDGTISAGSISFVPAGSLFFNSGNLSVGSSFVLNPSSSLTFTGTSTFTSPGTITFTTAAIFPTTRGANPATIIIDAPTALFPRGLRTGGPPDVFITSTGGVTFSDVVLFTTFDIQTAGSITFGGGVNVSNGNIVSAGSININGMWDGATALFDAGGDISISSNPVTISGGALSIVAGNDINIAANANIQTELSVDTLLLQAGGDISAGDSLFMQSHGPILGLAGGSFTVSGSSGQMNTFNADDITLVTDNANSQRPNFGMGAFTFPSGFTFQTNSGMASPVTKVFLYTSIPGISTFPSSINGEAYSAGIFTSTSYTTGTNEFLDYYYPELPPDPKFQIMYKTTGIMNPVVIETIEVAVTEPVSNPPQITDVVEGNLQTPSTPDPKTPCRTPPVAVQSL